MSSKDALIWMGWKRLKNDHDENPYWTHTYPSTFDDRKNFSPPPADMFRAALNPDAAPGKAVQTKGKGTVPDPFRD